MSIWSDMQDRSSGETVRKEDNLDIEYKIKKTRRVIKGKTYDINTAINCMSRRDEYEYCGWPVKRIQTMYQRKRGGEYFIHSVAHRMSKDGEIMETQTGFEPVSEEYARKWMEGKVVY